MYSTTHLGINQQAQGEGHGAPEAAVHHDELVHHLELVEAVVVGDGGQQDHTCRENASQSTNLRRRHRVQSKITDDPEECAEADGAEDKVPVPLVVVVDGGHAEEHEDDGLGRAAQHLHGVL